MANLRHRVPPPQVRAGRLSVVPRARHDSPQRRAGSRQRRVHGPHRARPPCAVLPSRRQAAAGPAGPRPSCAIPEHLDPRVVRLFRVTPMRRVPLLLAAALAATPALSGQIPAAATGMLRRIYGSRDFAPDRFGPARWIERGAAYTTVEPSEAVRGGGASDIVRYETATGARSVLVSARRLIPAGDSVPLDIDDYGWSADGAQLLLFTNSQRVWRQNTRGDYWVLNRTTWALRQLGGRDAPASSLMYAKFSPQGDRVAYVRQGDLYVERVSDGTITRLTVGADSLHVNGMSDWVYEEEFDLRDGFRWSPDGTKLAYWHFDMTGVRTFTLINNTDSLYPYTIPIQYPKAGTPNSAVTAGVVGADGGPTTWLQVDGDS